MPAFIHKDDVGLVLELTIKDENDAIVNISAATVKQIKLRTPTNVYSTKTASFTTDGTDGKIRYTTVAGDLSVAGEWEIRGYIEQGASTKFHTSKQTFEVREVT